MRVPAQSSVDVRLYECGHFPLVMIEAKLSWWEGQGSSCGEVEQEIYVSPAALSECCTAESLWAALRQKLPVAWDDLATRCGMVVVLLGHDAHRANLRLYRGIVEKATSNVLVVSSRCGMHQLQLVLCSTYRCSALSFHTPYSACANCCTLANT